MNLRMFVCGLLVGCAIGLMAGGALVQVPGDRGDDRIYPQGIALLLALVGGIGAGSAIRGQRSQ